MNLPELFTRFPRRDQILWHLNNGSFELRTISHLLALLLQAGVLFRFHCFVERAPANVGLGGFTAKWLNQSLYEYAKNLHEGFNYYFDCDFYD
jgi:hypothetical protein